MLIEFLYVFCAAFVLGFTYSMYIRRTGAAKSWRERHIAAASGSVLYLLGAVVVISYVGNHWLLASAVLGDYLGSLLQLTLDQRKESKSNQSLSS